MPPEGRYRNVSSKARLPANGLAASRSSRNVPTTTAVVPDPFTPKDRVLVSVNRKVDILEWEYSHGRLSESAYRTGRLIQGVFERAQSRSQSSWSLSDRVDAYQAKETQIITSLERAQLVTAYMAKVESSVGRIGARFLQQILQDGRTYAELAAMRGQSNESGRTAAATRFRQLLEDIAEDWAAKGGS